jgi:hypothetical protein
MNKQKNMDLTCHLLLSCPSKCMLKAKGGGKILENLPEVLPLPVGEVPGLGLT